MAIQAAPKDLCAYSYREEGLRYALAAGATEAFYLNDPETIDFDIALVGSTGDRLAAQLAEGKQCALLLDIIDAGLSAENELEVVRDLGRGAREVLSVSGPVVLRVSDEAHNRMYVSRFRRQSVDSSGFGEIQSPESSSQKTSPWELVKPRARTGNLAERTGGSASSRADDIYGTAEVEQSGSDETLIEASALTAARHLLRFLKHHEFISQDLTDPAEALPDQEKEGVDSGPARKSSSRGPRGPGARRGPRPVTESREATRSRPAADDAAGSSRGPGVRDRGPRAVGRRGTGRRKPQPVEPSNNT